jgi:uncharacterized protein UPF0236
VNLLSVSGWIELEVLYGWDRFNQQWLCPARMALGLENYQQMTPELEDRLCFTATESGSYERAAKVAAKWGSPIEDSTIQRHVQKAGARAEVQTQERTIKLLDPATRAEGLEHTSALRQKKPFSMVVMMDGHMARERGPDWGLKPSHAPGNRVEWHEVKSAVIYRFQPEDEPVQESKRLILLDKQVVARRMEAEDFGQSVHAQALRCGMAQAQHVFVVCDGGVWIWKIKEDRFVQAIGVLDFYHASQHLWAVAHQLYPEDGTGARQWIEPLLSQMKAGQAEQVIGRLEDLPRHCERHGKTLDKDLLEKQLNYFREHRDHMHYEQARQKGAPIGSGAMESFCSQLQHRIKRTGQFWSTQGLNRLLALEVAKRNLDWDAIWAKN